MKEQCFYSAFIQAMSSYYETWSLHEANFLVIENQNEMLLNSLYIGCCVWERQWE